MLRALTYDLSRSVFSFFHLYAIETLEHLNRSLMFTVNVRPLYLVLRNRLKAFHPCNGIESEEIKGGAMRSAFLKRSCLIGH